LVNSIEPLDFQLSMQLSHPLVAHFPSPHDTRKQPKCSSLAMHPWMTYKAFGSGEDYSKPYLNYL